MARRGGLSDLSAQLPRLRRRRRRRPRRASRRRLDYVASLGVDAIWLSPFFRSPMKDFGYDVSDYRDVDPLFGTLADFDALLARGARARPEGDHRPGLVAHLRPASLVRREQRLARQPAGPTGTSGPTPSRTARRPTTGWPRSAGRPGPGSRQAAAVLPAQLPARAAGPQLLEPGSAGRDPGHRPASGSTAASTASGSTSSTTTSTTASCATIRRLTATARR